MHLCSGCAAARSHASGLRVAVIDPVYPAALVVLHHFSAFTAATTLRPLTLIRRSTVATSLGGNAPRADFTGTINGKRATVHALGIRLLS